MLSKFIAFAAACACKATHVSSNEMENFCGNLSASEWVDELIQSITILTVSNAQYTGACDASGIVTYNDGINFVGYTLGIGETALLLTTGNLSTALDSLNKADSTSHNYGVAGDSELESLVHNEGY